MWFSLSRKRLANEGEMVYMQRIEKVKKRLWWRYHGILVLVLVREVCYVESGTRFNKKSMVHRVSSSDMAEKVLGISKQVEDGDFEVISNVREYIA